MKSAYCALALSAILGLVHSAAADDKGAVVTLGTLKSAAPAAWKQQTPANKLRAYQFAVGDADLAIFFFGENGGGTPSDNIKRWKSQFVAPEGKTIDDVSKVEKFKVGPAELTCLDIHGTFLSKNPPFDPNAKVVRKDNYRRFGVYFACPGGPYFITLTGPAATLEQNRRGFEDWLKNFK
jgi:hypothetical protein